MNTGVYVVKQPVTEVMWETYYELDPPKSPPTLLDKLRNWIHELRDFVVNPPPPREQVHLLVAPSLDVSGTKPSPSQDSQR
jgi:hypothetical protein